LRRGHVLPSEDPCELPRSGRWRRRRLVRRASWRENRLRGWRLRKPRLKQPGKLTGRRLRGRYGCRSLPYRSRRWRGNAFADHRRWCSLKQPRELARRRISAPVGQVPDLPARCRLRRRRGCRSLPHGRRWGWGNGFADRLRWRSLEQPRELARRGLCGPRGCRSLRYGRRWGGFTDRLRWRSLEQPRELARRRLRWRRGCRSLRHRSRRWRGNGLADRLRWRRLEHLRELARRGLRSRSSRGGLRWRQGRGCRSNLARWRRRMRTPSRTGLGCARYVPYAHSGKRLRRTSRPGRRRRRLRNRNYPFQVRQSAERLGRHERSPLVVSDFEQIGAVGPLRATELLQKVRMQPGLLAHEQKHGDSPPRSDLAGVEHFDAFILQEIQQFVFLVEVHAHPVP
jgi:hypothetical protein